MLAQQLATKDQDILVRFMLCTKSRETQSPPLERQSPAIDGKEFCEANPSLIWRSDKRGADQAADHALDRSRDNLTAKIHMLCDANARGAERPQASDLTASLTQYEDKSISQGECGFQLPK